MKSGLTDALTQIKNGFSTAWTTILDNTKSKFKSLYDSIAGYVNNIGTSISNMLTKISNGISSGWNSIVSFVSNAKNKLSGVSIPKFASGGVITKPTVAMVGEYSGASRNPEIITPESLLRGIIAEGNDDITDTFIQVGRQIVEAIQNNNVDIRIGDDVISAAAARGDRDYKKRTGRSQFA